MNQPLSKSRSSLIGALGLSLGAILGNAATYLIAISGIVGWLLGYVQEGQTLIRLVFALLLAFLTIGIGGAVTGAVAGLSLRRIDLSAHRGSLVGGAAYAFGVGQGIIVFPTLLLISLIALYNNGPQSQPQGYALLFGALGLAYGLIIGLILALLSVRFLQSWKVFLAAAVGYLLGGVLLGLFVWRADAVSTGVFLPVRAVLRLLIASLLVNLPSGGMMGFAYYWIARKRAASGDKAVNPRRWQQVVVMLVSLLVLVFVGGIIRNVKSFLTINPAATATQLSSETLGVHWSAPSDLTSGSDPSPGYITASKDGMVAVVWSQDQDGQEEVFYAYLEAGQPEETAWSTPLNISNSPDGLSSQAQIALDEEGGAFIVWQERDSVSGESQILYSRCQEAECAPPAPLSNPADAACAEQLSGGADHSPTIAIDSAGQIMSAWSSGEGPLLYATWPAEEPTPESLTGCIAIGESGDTPHLEPRLSAGSTGTFALAYSPGELVNSDDIFVTYYKNDAWSDPDVPVGRGFAPEVLVDEWGQTHLTWCGEDGQTHYQFNGGQIEQVRQPGCLGRPTIGLDSEGFTHLVWFSDQVVNLSGVTSHSQLIYESVRTQAGWSPAAIVALTGTSSQPALAVEPGGTLHLAWNEALEPPGALNYAHQEVYQCETDSLSRLGQVALDTIQNGNFHPEDYRVPYCGNQFIDFVYQPNPNPAFASEAPTTNGGFDRTASLADRAQYEVLFVNMQWDADENNLSPGTSFAREVAELYGRVKENPSLYPRGMQVRILLGNYPEMATLEWGSQIWNVLDDLRDAGVQEMDNPKIGWKIEVADFAGTFPHSHTKFIIVDGKFLLGAGFNYSWFHLPKDHPSGKGDSLNDLGIIVQGPAAQAAISAYDDMWVGANQLHCSALFPTDGASWKDTCQWGVATGGHLPEVLKYYLAEGGDNAFSLFRSAAYKEADDTYAAVLGSAQSSIDAIHVNFSLKTYCIMNLINDSICTFDDALPWMSAIMQAVDENHVKVRVMVESANMNGLENRASIQVFQTELEKRGLEDLVEIRFFDGRLHMKTALIDEEILFVGSQNFHYSSWGENGLLEYVVASDDPDAISAYQTMFDFYWEQAIPLDEADWSSPE